jgi:hypothetical protein
MIHYNGDVACCCEDMYGELMRFNIFETSIKEIWYSGRHAQIVDALLVGDRQKYDLCKSAPWDPVATNAIQCMEPGTTIRNQAVDVCRDMPFIKRWRSATAPFAQD